jgi:hypothetical protein
MKPAHDPVYVVEHPVGESLVRRVAQLFARNGNPKEVRHLDWQYVNNPGGGGYTAIAVSEDGSDAAAYSLFKVPARIGNNPTMACQSLDTLTDAAHRGKGLFSLLASDVNRQCDIENVGFVYGFPNDKSAPGFFRKLGWKSLGHPPFLIFVSNFCYLVRKARKTKLNLPNFPALAYVQIASYLRRVLGGYEVQFGTGFLDRYNSLWREFSAGIEFCVERDLEYVKWRYLRRPDSDYRFISVYKKGTLNAIVVYVLREKHEGKIGYVMDVIFHPLHARAANLAVGKAVLLLTLEGADVVLAWGAKGFLPRGAYTSNLFAPLPRFAQPIKLFFGVRIRPDGGEDLPARGMFVSYADSDTV